ncbi:hypothetical protein GCM10027053_34260 [Intrasporangium mesophilum]
MVDEDDPHPGAGAQAPVAVDDRPGEREGTGIGTDLTAYGGPQVTATCVLVADQPGDVVGDGRRRRGHVGPPPAALAVVERACHVQPAVREEAGGHGALVRAGHELLHREPERLGQRGPALLGLRLEIVAGGGEPLGAVGVVAAVDVLAVQGEVVLDELAQLRAGKVRPAVEDAVDRAVGGEPVVEVRDLVTSRRDRLAAGDVVDVPVVDGLVERRDPRRLGPERDGERLVLVEDPLGEADRVLVEEVAAHHLGDRDRVVPEGGTRVERRDGTTGVCRCRKRRDPLGSLVVPRHRTRGDVGVLGLGDVDQPPERTREVLVVAVDESDPATARLVEAQVARGARSAVVLPTVHHPHTWVGGGERVGDPSGVIGRPVVDDEHFDAAGRVSR